MKLQRGIGVLLVLAGVVWSVMFPKNTNVLAFDFVGSVALGLGLIVSGILVYRLTRARLVMTAMGILLMWSLLWNAYMAALVHAHTQMVLDQLKFARQHGH